MSILELIIDCCSSVALAESIFKYPSDGFLYVLEGTYGYVWTIGMFKSSEKKTTIKIKKQPIKLNYSLWKR